MISHQQAVDVAKAAPPITVTTATIAGYSVNELLLWLTVVYTALQILLLVRRLVVSRRVTDPDPDCADCPTAKRKR